MLKFGKKNSPEEKLLEDKKSNILFFLNYYLNSYVNITKENVYLSKVVLDLIKNFDDFRLSLQATFTEIYAEIESFKNNPNCSCKNKIESFVNSNRDRVYEFVATWHKSHEQVDLAEFIKAYVVNNVSGKVFRIDNNDKSFEEFSRKIYSEKFSFRAFDIVNEGEKLAFYFI